MLCYSEFVLMYLEFWSRRDARKLIIIPGKRVICLEIIKYIFYRGKKTLQKSIFTFGSAVILHTRYIMCA